MQKPLVMKKSSVPVHVASSGPCMGQNWKPTMRDPSYHMWLGHNYHNWLFNIAMENGPFIDDVPSYKPPFMVGIFHGYVSHNQMVS